MADKSPQQTIQELKDLVVAYFKQETLEPFKGIGRYLGFGVAGATLLGVGVFFLAMGGLRALQSETGSTFTGTGRGRRTASSSSCCSPAPAWRGWRAGGVAPARTGATTDEPARQQQGQGQGQGQT